MKMRAGCGGGVVRWVSGTINSETKEPATNK